MLAWAPRGLAEPPWPVRTAWLAAGLTVCGALGAVAGGEGTVARVERGLLVETALALALFDARHLLIPDLFSAAVTLAGLAGPLSPGLWPALAGAALGAALTGAVRLAAGRMVGAEAMGLGDVKLAAALGALLGPLALLWAVAVAAGLGAVVGLVLRQRAPGAVVPFGAVLAPVGVLWLWFPA